MLTPTDHVTVLCWGTPSLLESNARKIAAFTGGVATVVSVAGARDAESIRQLVQPCAGLIVHAEVLVQMAGSLDTGAGGLLCLFDLAPQVFVFGFAAATPCTQALHALSSAGLQGVMPLPASGNAFRIADSRREWFGQFSGLSIRGADGARDAAFIEGVSGGRQAVLVRSADQPFFVRVDHGKSAVFFVACSEMGDLEEPVDSDAGLAPWFSRLVPLMVFLRIALGNRIWRSGRSQGCFIIDDPLLRRRYGFLEYSKLLEAMSGQMFSACIAFIPWNYRRSRKQIAELFSTASSSLSLCVHGCDHTRGEFAAASVDELHDRARVALERMEAHSELSGLPFDKVMVFPQGLFSQPALKALDGCGYLAAVNTDPCPSNMPRALALKDLMDVAVTKFGGVPLFTRHCPRDVAEFAFDLFLGKPALVVEHHGYFRNGYSDLRNFVRRLNEIDEELEWGSLAGICRRACLQRVGPDGQVHVRFYANRFAFTNRGTQSTTYVFSRLHASGGPLPAVTINGRPWPREQEGDSLTIRLTLEAGGAAELEILPENPTDAAALYWKPTKRYHTRVLVRRILSEFRDNHVDTSAWLTGLLSSTRKVRARVLGTAPRPDSSWN
jgi:hypothetical protein